MRQTEPVVVSAASRLPILDGLRGLVLLVPLVHFSDGVQHTGLAVPAFRIVTYSALVGLEIFFVLSGFLITGILLDTKHSSSYFRTFYARRFLRIFPLYYGFLILYFIVLPRVVSWDVQPLTLVQHSYYWGYLMNIALAFNWGLDPITSHLWSLAVEEQFYLMWPFVVYACSQSQLKKACLGCLIGALLIRFWLVSVGADSIVFYALTPTRMDGLALGALLAVCAREPRGLDFLLRAAKPAAAIAVGAVLITVYSGATLSRYDGALHMAIYLTAAVYIAGATLARSLIAKPGGLWDRALGNWPARQVGQYSYAIYILHLPLAWVLDRAGVLPRVSADAGVFATLAYCATAIACSIAAAALSWHLYEKPFLKLRRYLPYNFGAKPPAKLRTADTAA